MGQFTVSEADTILAVEFDVLNGRVEEDVYPNHIQSANLLLAKLYTNYFAYIVESLELCGLQLKQVGDIGFNWCVSFINKYVHLCIVH